MDDSADSVPSRSISVSLLRGAKQADPVAWGRLVELFHPFVYRWLRHWGVPESDAPDLEQNVFTRVFAAISRFDREKPGTSFRGWLWRICRNEAIDYFRARRPQQLDERFLSAIPDVQDAEEMQNEGVQLLRRVLTMIADDFHPKTFAVFHRCVLESRDTEEVAAEFGMKPSAVREAKRRVLQRLREECLELLGQGNWVI